MEIYKILLEILEKPNAPKFYRHLKDYYKLKNRLQEESAINFLLEKKFERKDDINNTNSSEKQ